ncbi:low molecular weight phosphatase family protein [Rhodococcus sp. 15-725-2-2b]|uniref:arsenate reductase/protein-tyrosine-phosphatase family protein n=1 Tax=unclassified Rhodococcus (in: high G+C Gram-positive bacteria) TaxID=192944 RepID=UPI000B9B901E|nr:MULTISPECIES: low molecular weight phosphatase family protein [unclassified Rhodococcus (in: high G+C Gram-positive bacteria)]OZC62562.1 low molecular weight phosphatase family protein [Rhodococcus sp. 06-469-3-2]OZD50070.1 low molecular weight phosphatase family protein [Rhodococcus sp. 06-1477-1A]OZE76320.1 low molecular weight phosphatase family protein [Rhodococcus sp. 15-725-2-2b]
MRVLFVCTGNICRSPTAERLAAAFAREGGFELTASSAGTQGLTGHAMDPTAATVLTQLGGDPEGFVARRLTPAIAADADLVLTMTAAHRDAVLALAPRQMRRTFTLLEAAGLAAASGASTVATLADARAVHRVDTLDIGDPYRRDHSVYEQAGELIAETLPQVLRLSTQ